MTLPTGGRWRFRRLSLTALAGLLLASQLLAGSPPSGTSAAKPDPTLAASFEQAWTRVRDTYYDPAMHGLDWRALHDELAPKAAAAKTVEEERTVIEDLVGRLGESHFAVLPRAAATRPAPASPAASSASKHEAPAPPPAGPPGDLGFDVRVLDGKVVVSRVVPDGPAATAGLRPGWILTRLDDMDTAAAVAEAARDPHHADLAEVEVVQAVRSEARGTAGSVTHLELIHGGDHAAMLEIARRPFPGTFNSFGNLPPLAVETEERTLPGRIGYFRFNLFLTPVAEPFDKATCDFVAAHDAGVILDLRGNPGGIGGMVMGMAGHLMSESGRSLGTLRTRDAELHFLAVPQAEGHVFTGPVAVLVDELSMSTAEILAAGLKDNGRARLFGTRTAGMALPSLIEELPDGDRLQFVLADLTGPDGARIEGHGVAPDEDIPLTRQALLAGGDPALDAAAKWISATAAPGGAEASHAGAARSAAGAAGPGPWAPPRPVE